MQEKEEEARASVVHGLYWCSPLVVVDVSLRKRHYRWRLIGACCAICDSRKERKKLALNHKMQ